MKKFCYLALLMVSSNVWATEPFETQAETAIRNLRQYCGACHGLGKLRFLWTQSAEENWQQLFTAEAPRRKIPWAEAIIEVLDWPNDSAPDFTTGIDANRDWMPKGSKRLDFSEAKINDESARRWLIHNLSSEIYRRLSPN